MPDPEKSPEELKQAEADLKAIEDAKVTEAEAEEKLETATTDRLIKTFVTGEKLEKQPEPSEESDDSTPKDKDSADETDDKDGPTAAEKLEEEKLEAATKAGEEKGDEGDEVKDVDADKGKDKEKETPPLSDAYVRAAIHRGWKQEDIEELYENNPKLAIKTFGNIYEAVNRSSREFAEFGRARKEQLEAAAKAGPQSKEKTGNEPEFKGVDVEALKKADVEPEVIATIEAMNQQSKLQFDELQELKTTRSASTTGQPSGADLQQARAVEQESAAIQQQIGTFFNSDGLKGYADFYGVLPKDAINWDTLTPGQKMNRWTVIEMMDQMVTGATALGREMKIDEAINLAHLSVTEQIREKVIREDIMTKVSERSKSLSLKPSGTAQPAKTGLKTKEDLEEVTTERLHKVFNK